MRALRAGDRVGGARGCALARPRRPGRGRGSRERRDARGPCGTADRGDDRDRVRSGHRARAWLEHRHRRRVVRPRGRPARGPRRGGTRWERRHVDDRGRPARFAAQASRHVHAPDGRRPAGTRPDRPHPAGRRERCRDRRRIRAERKRHHGARARPSAAPRPDRGDPRRRRPDQADPGRRRDRVDLGSDPRHERPPRGRHRRHAPGDSLGGGAPLPRRRAAGTAVADDARRDRRLRPNMGWRTSTASSRPTTWPRAR